MPPQNPLFYHDRCGYDPEDLTPLTPPGAELGERIGTVRVRRGVRARYSVREIGH